MLDNLQVLEVIRGLDIIRAALLESVTDKPKVKHTMRYFIDNSDMSQGLATVLTNAIYYQSNKQLDDVSITQFIELYPKSRLILLRGLGKTRYKELEFVLRVWGYNIIN